MKNIIGCDIPKQQNMNSQRYHSKTVRSATYFQSLNAHGKSRHGRKDDSNCDQVKIRPKSTETVVYHFIPNTTKQGSPRNKTSPRASPSKDGSSRVSPTLGNLYAGAKFSEPPAPASLPKPPPHWTALMSRSLVRSESMDPCHHDFSNRLKILLNVQA